MEKSYKKISFNEAARLLYLNKPDELNALAKKVPNPNLPSIQPTISYSSIIGNSIPIEYFISIPIN
jgi:hypothetical protein